MYTVQTVLSRSDDSIQLCVVVTWPLSSEAHEKEQFQDGALVWLRRPGGSMLSARVVGNVWLDKPPGALGYYIYLRLRGLGQQEDVPFGTEVWPGRQLGWMLYQAFSRAFEPTSPSSEISTAKIPELVCTLEDLAEQLRKGAGDSEHPV